MDTQNLSIAIQAFIKKQSTNAAYYEENWNERKERKAYYQSFTKDKLLAMTEEDFLEYISRLWAVLMWGNKKYVVDKLIEDNGFSTLKKQLADLNLGEELLLTEHMMKSGEQVFLDDVTVEELSGALQVPITIVKSDGKSFLDAVLGRSEN